MSYRKLSIALVAAGLLSAAAAQSAPSRDTPRPPAATLPADGTQTVTARLQQWLVNPNGDVDGLLLDDGTQVAVAPRLSAQLLKSLQLKDSLQVTGRRVPGAPLLRASLVVSTARGVSVADEPSAAPPPAPRDGGNLTAMSASGRITRLLYAPRGEAAGAIVDDGTIVRFPPHVGAALGATLAVGRPFYARGFGTRTDRGNALEATAIGTTADTARDVFGPPPGPLADARGPLPPAAGRPQPPAGREAPAPGALPPPPVAGAAPANALPAPPAPGAAPASSLPPPDATARSASAPR